MCIYLFILPRRRPPVLLQLRGVGREALVLVDGHAVLDVELGGGEAGLLWVREGGRKGRRVFEWVDEWRGGDDLGPGEQGKLRQATGGYISRCT